MTELAVNVDADADRAQAMVNSPKQDDSALGNFQDDGADGNDGVGMSLNLGDVDDEQEDVNKVTPNTKQRDQMGINSPRNKQKQDWGDDSSGMAGLVTQVQREDGNSGGGSGVESLVTQVPRDKRDDDETSMTIAEKTQPGGMCACLSCLWTCCSGPQAPEPVPMSSHDADGARQKKTETANSSLLATTGGRGNEERKSGRDREDSVSSTVYDTNLLPPLSPENANKKCLVLDLDETLVHSSFKPIPKPDFIIPVEIDRVVHHVYVLKRPYVDEFLLRASKHYEIVIFTASLSKYADPLLDKLDVHNVIEHRLFRESCVIEGTAYVKDLRKLNRKLKDTIIVDNSPPSYLFQPANAVPIASWFDDQADTQLLDFCPVIETTMKNVPDVRCLLDANSKSFRWLCNQANVPVEKYTVRNDRN